MKLFSLNSHVDVGEIAAALSASPMGGMPVYYPDPYPEAAEGIELSEDRDVFLGSVLKMPVAKELLESDNPSWVRRDRNRIFLLQASIDTVDGVRTWVPPKPDDDAACVKLDLSGYPYLWIRYQAEGEQEIARIGLAEGYPEERMLARIERFKPLRAQRLDQKYLFWGETRERERLLISYDGRTIFYDTQRVKVPGFWSTLFG